MNWGISFKIPAKFESALWELPEPSLLRRLSSMDGKTTLNVLYHFQYPPQSWREWQRVAGIKAQIKKRISCVVFCEYETIDFVENVYFISELGSYFTAFIKFPKPLFPNSKKDVYKKLCVHAKRLHYEGLLHIEQLIATSIRFGVVEENKVDIHQKIKRAMSSYKFALKHKDGWKTKLGKKERYKVLSESAKKSAIVRINKAEDQKKLVLALKNGGKSLKDIVEILEISRTTVWRFLK